MDRDFESILQRYEAAMRSAWETRQRLLVRWRSMAFLRGGLFLASLVPLLFALQMVSGTTTVWLVLAGVLFLAFLIVAVIHEKMSSQISLLGMIASMNSESVARLQRRLDVVRAPACTIPDAFIPVADDLDLFGDNSLYRLLATPRTPCGVQTLVEWIANPAVPVEIRARQVAIHELRQQPQWREEFQLRCEQLAVSPSGPSRFVEWVSSENWTDQRRWLLLLCRFTATITLLSFVLTVAGVVPLAISGPILLGTFLINFFISVVYSGSMHDIFNLISSHHGEIANYRVLFNQVVKFHSKSPFLRTIQDQLTETGHDVRGGLASLGWWNFLANIRRNGILFLAYLVFQFLFVWDIHVLERLERWKDQYGRFGRIWFGGLGRWEAIMALSKLAHDNPDWVFPELVDEETNAYVQCQQLGHPLLDQTRVCNDVLVGPPGTVLLVTGSNMSGKSTLLRSLGVNIVLAQMGSVVCAGSMKLPPLHLETSMRVVDSLAKGTSFFMAELKRLKQIVECSKQLHPLSQTVVSPNNVRPAPQRRLFFLLDEILQGTNSVERHIAVSQVVKSLMTAGAIGAISTHDLDLASADELRDACVPVHFCEHFVDLDGQPTMAFDFRLRPGISTTTNALKLLELVGLS